MTRRTRRRRIAAIAALTLLVAGTPALAWVFDIPFKARVNGHDFHRLEVEGDDCQLTMKLWFDAPEAKYDSRAKNRNYYRFRARLVFQNGKSVITPVFGNGAPGKRLYTVRHDTSHQACWAKEKVELRDIDIEGCRARNCKVKAFARLIPEYE